jgi:hypothetical protein
MSLTVYTVREIKENEMDEVLDVFGSASNAVTAATDTLGEKGSSPTHIAKIVADSELRSQLRKTGELSLTSEDGETTLVLNKQPVK